MKSRLYRLLLVMLGIAGFLCIGILLEDDVGIPFETTYRIVCAGACLVFIAKLASDHPGENWPKVAFSISLVVNVAMLFTPLFARPISRGEIMVFALPDATVWLAARAFSYSVRDDHERAVRQQLILGLVLAVAFTAILFFMVSLGQVKPRWSAQTSLQRQN